MPGTVSPVTGAVVDCQFTSVDEVPAIFSALKTKIGNEELTLEVQQQLDGNVVRTVAMGSTDGLSRGVAVEDTKAPISVPVGPETLGRMFNVLGEPIDGMPQINIRKRYPIHRPAPKFSEQSTETEVLKRASKSSTSSARF